MVRKTIMVAAGAAVAGLAALGGTAFTGTGLGTADNLPADQFIGGTVTQTVSGATLDSIVYGFPDGDNTHTQISSITLTFAASVDGRTVTVTPSGGTGTFDCTPAGTTATCDYQGTGSGYSGLSSIDVTVV